jgi:hypothetical protein
MFSLATSEMGVRIFRSGLYRLQCLCLWVIGNAASWAFKGLLYSRPLGFF